MVLWAEYRNENNIPDLKEHTVYGGRASGISVMDNKHAGCGGWENSHLTWEGFGEGFPEMMLKGTLE